MLKRKNEVEAYSVDLIRQDLYLGKLERLIALANEMPGIYGMNPDLKNDAIIIHVLYDSEKHRNEAYTYLSNHNDEESNIVALNLGKAYVNKKYLK